MRNIGVAGRSKSWVCGRSLAGTNAAGRMDVCLVSVQASAMGRSVVRGFLPSVVCLSVISKPQQ